MAAHHEQAAGAATTERSSGSSLLREVAEVVVLAVILYVGISFAVQAVHVEGLSMFATLDNNDYLIANKIDYRLHAPQRGDIIILRPDQQLDRLHQARHRAPGREDLDPQRRRLHQWPPTRRALPARGVGERQQLSAQRKRR